MCRRPDDERLVSRRSTLIPVILTTMVAVLACGDPRDPRDTSRRTSTDVAPPADAPPPRERSGCVVDPGSGETRYRVRTGDTLSGIAERVYGDAWLWREIARANPEAVGSDGDVRAGSELIIPFAGR